MFITNICSRISCIKQESRLRFPPHAYPATILLSTTSNSVFITIFKSVLLSFPTLPLQSHSLLRHQPIISHHSPLPRRPIAVAVSANVTRIAGSRRVSTGEKRGVAVSVWGVVVGVDGLSTFITLLADDGAGLESGVDTGEKKAVAV